MARDRTRPEDFTRPLRRILVGGLVLLLLGIFLLWRIDSPRVERFRAALIDRVVPSFDWMMAPMTRMAGLYLRGDHEGARDVQLALLPLIRALFAEVNPIPCKAAMEMMGLCGGEVRLPLVPIGEENRVKLRAALIDAGVEL